MTYPHPMDDKTGFEEEKDHSPFGRQRKPVKVTLEGYEVDVDFYINHLMRAAEFCDDITTRNGNSFTIYPRANND